MSITVPTYAISVTYLARETSKSIQDLHKRRKELAEKLEELRKKLEDEAGVKAIEQEMAKYKEEDERLKDRQHCLSAKGAVGYPFAGLFTGLAVAAYGYYAGGNGWVPLALFLSMGYGVYRLAKSLVAIEQAAMRPEEVLLPALGVSFETRARSMSFKVAEQREVRFRVFNMGNDIAEKVHVMLFFTPEFQISPGPNYTVTRQGPLTRHPNHDGVTLRFQEIHVNLSQIRRVKLKTPDKPGTYDVPVEIRERRIGNIHSRLRFEVSA